MPFVYTDAYISIANTVLQATKVTVKDSTKKIPASRMGDTAAGNSIAGLPDQSITAVFLQDFSAGEVHATIRAALLATRAGNTVEVIVRPSSAAASNTNPQWTGQMKVFDYTPIDGAFDDKQDVTVTFETDGTALVYAAA